MCVRRTILFVCLTLYLFSCESNSTHHEPVAVDDDAHDAPGVVHLAPEMLESVGIRTAAAVRRVLPAQLETTGKVDFEQNHLAHVSPRIPGRVEAVRAELGDSIRKGQVLVVIDSIELGQAKSEFLQAMAHENLTRRDFERVRGLFVEGIASEQQLQSAKAGHLESVAMLQSSRGALRLYGLSDRAIEALDYDDDHPALLEIVSPLAGRIIDKHVTIGELVTPDRTVFSIADVGRVWIWIDIYEGDLGKVHLEDDVAVTVEAYPADIFGGRVSYVSDQVDSDTRTVRARIDVENPARRLKPGMFARVTLSDPHFDRAEAEPSLVIPTAAVQRDGERSIVFVALGDSLFERKEVTLGRRAGETVEILSGLDAESDVVVEGAFLLKSEASKASMGGGHDH